MDTLIHADIFFFITSIFVIILCVAALVCSVFVILILVEMRHIAKVARREGDNIAQDIQELRSTVKGEGIKVKSVVDFFLALFMTRMKRGKK